MRLGSMVVSVVCLTTEPTVRRPLDVDPANAASMFRYFNVALKAGVIRIGNRESKSTKDRWYLPAWA